MLKCGPNIIIYLILQIIWKIVTEVIMEYSNYGLPFHFHKVDSKHVFILSAEQEANIGVVWVSSCPANYLISSTRYRKTFVGKH